MSGSKKAPVIADTPKFSFANSATAAAIDKLGSPVPFGSTAPSEATTATPTTPTIPMDPAAALWAQCLARVGVPFALKGTEAHAKVMALFKAGAKDLPARVPTTKWEKCCAHFGHQFVRKGTPEYDQVMQRFMSLPDDRAHGDVTMAPVNDSSAYARQQGKPDYYTKAPKAQLSASASAFVPYNRPIAPWTIPTPPGLFPLPIPDPSGFVVRSPDSRLDQFPSFD